jgi:hypothetical protein
MNYVMLANVAPGPMRIRAFIVMSRLDIVFGVFEAIIIIIIIIVVVVVAYLGCPWCKAVRAGNRSWCREAQQTRTPVTSTFWRCSPCAALVCALSIKLLMPEA